MTSRKSRLKRQNLGIVSSRRIIVFAEGEKTEPAYINHWRSTYRTTATVIISPFHGPPKKLVDRAVEKKREDRRTMKRDGDPVGVEYWCVFDRNRHANLSEALKKANDNGIHIAMSNPCIELWFVLHYQDQTAHIESGQAQRLSRQLLKSDKFLSETARNDLAGRFPEAKNRAQSLDRMHELDGRPARSNPSSDIWRLIDSIMRSEEGGAVDG